MHDEEEQDYAFQYWFERGYPIKKIHSRLPALKPEYYGVDRAVHDELVEIELHKPVKITESVEK